jgi:hypothetical protein
MKPIIPFALLGALFAAGAASAATTTPVGYITVNLAANGETYVSPTMVQASSFAGASTVSPSGGKVITFSGGVPTGLGSGDVLEVGSSGWWSTVTSSTATTITVVDNFPAGLPANTSVSVRKHNTLLTFLGLNAPGLIDYDGSKANDEVQVLDPTANPQKVATYAWVTGPNLGDPNNPNGAWFNLGTSTVDNNVVIEPGTAIRIKHVGATPLSFATSGTVKTTPTQVDVFAKFNWIGTPLATGGTLNGMNFNNQLVEYDGSSPNYDELQILGSNQVATPFAAITDGVTAPNGKTMFNLATSTDGGAQTFPEGTGVVINRIGNPSSTITIPATQVGQ